MQPAVLRRAFGFSGCTSDGGGVGGRGTERWRSLGGGGNKKEIPLLLCEPGALRRLIQSQCSVQGRLRVSWV